VTPARPAARYLLLMYRDEKRWEKISEEERTAVRQAAYRFHENLRRRGLAGAGDPLQPTRTAATVRRKAGRTVTTDGPFAETKEQLGGYTILRVQSRRQAISIAARHPLVRVGRHSIEIRPIREREPSA
jgi:hypothetical protein